MLSRLMTRREQFVLAFLAMSIVVGALVLVQRARHDAPGPLVVEEAAGAVPEKLEASAVATPAPTPEIAGTPAQPAVQQSEIVVSVQGAVMRPGMYTFHAGDRVQDAIARTGGLMDAADTSPLNLAAKLVDATTLTIPTKPRTDITSRRILRKEMAIPSPNPAAYTLVGSLATPNASITSSMPRGISGGRININTATQAQLESLPGIGPSYASAIIAYRQQHSFSSVEELMEIRGIGAKRFASIKDLVSVN